MNYSVHYCTILGAIVSWGMFCMQQPDLSELFYKPAQKPACIETCESITIMDSHPSGALANLFLLLNQPKQITLKDEATNSSIARMQKISKSINLIEYFIDEQREIIIIENESYSCFPKIGAHKPSYNQAQLSFLWELIKLNILTASHKPKETLQKMLNSNTLKSFSQVEQKYYRTLIYKHAERLDISLDEKTSQNCCIS